jgi:hypothetical protein
MTVTGGARKLAHFVERKIDRWPNSRPVAVALPVEEQKASAPAATEVVSDKGGLPKARPLSGPAANALCVAVVVSVSR